MQCETNLDPVTDIHLLRAVARGDTDAVATLYRTHCDAILNFVYRRVAECYEDAQEITQDTFLTSLKLASTYRGESNAYVWLCGIARLRIVDFYRREGRDKRIPRKQTVSLDEALTLMLHTDDPQGERAREAVDLLMETLSEDEREAMMLRYVEELSVREIAAILQRSEKGVENLLLRAKEKQRKAAVAARLAIARREEKR